MTDLEVIINKGLNYFDQIPMEEVNNPDKYQLQLTGLSIFNRIFSLSILYGFFYILLKGTQFVLSVIIKTDINSVNYIYYMLPLLFLVESGMSKKKSLRDALFHFIRALFKLAVICSIDIMLSLILGLPH